MPLRSASAAATAGALVATVRRMSSGRARAMARLVEPVSMKIVFPGRASFAAVRASADLRPGASVSR